MTSLKEIEEEKLIIRFYNEILRKKIQRLRRNCVNIAEEIIIPAIMNYDEEALE